MLLIQSVTQATRKKTKPTSCQDHYPLPCPDALAQSYRRLLKAKDIELSSCKKHSPHCYDRNVDSWQPSNNHSSNKPRSQVLSSTP